MDLLKRIEAKYRYRDPIYGYIWLTANEKKIIDLPIFQRLRRISQLALTKHVYHSAEHTRFGHSLGVLQSASNIFLAMYRKNSAIFEEAFDENVKKYFKILRYAALLHDVGHMPFSHGIEKSLLEENVKHEHITQKIIEEDETISSLIRADEENINPREVSSLIIGETIQQLNILKKFISGELDADRSDYLLRDSYFCGVEYGKYDYSRYIHAFDLKKMESGGDYQIVIEEGSIPVIEAFLLARYHYNAQVVYHRTRIGYDKSLEKYAINLFERNTELKQKLTLHDFDFNFFTWFDDTTILSYAKNDYQNGEYWSKYIFRLDHLRPLEIVRNLNKLNRIYLNNIRRNLENCGFVAYEDFFDFRQSKNVHSLDEHEETDRDTFSVVKKSGCEEYGNIIENSTLLGKLKESPLQVGAIYVIPEKFNNAKKCRAEAFKEKIRHENA